MAREGTCTRLTSCLAVAPSMGEPGTRLTEYGSEDFGSLRAVMLHAPSKSLGLVNERTRATYLFDAIPDVGRYLEEHRAYRMLLESSGVRVHELDDHIDGTRALADRRPNLAYLHDIAVVTRRGAVLSRMASSARAGEETVVKEALGSLGIPVYCEFGPGHDFESFLALSRRTALIANTERHLARSIEEVIPTMLGVFDEVLVVEVPEERRFMHADMVFGLVAPDLALCFLPAIRKTIRVDPEHREQVDFEAAVAARGVEIIEVSGEEQQKWACSWVPLAPGRIIAYDISFGRQTREALARRGTEITEFHPEALLAGGGSLRCLTLALHRSG